jgi:phospholipid transport system substrate-binding protein
MNRRGLLFLPAAIVACIIGLGAPTAQAGAEADFIRKLGEQAISEMGQKNKSLAEREAAFRKILKQRFDMVLIGRFALGRYWRIASKEQRRDYLNLFTEYVVRTYSSSLGGYKNETLIVISSQPLKNKKDVLVNTRITRPSGGPIKAIWRVRTTKNRLRIIDVMVEGISMLVTHRQEFASVIRRHGLTGLLETLRARIGKLPATASNG